jgi:hypothetical protein
MKDTALMTEARDLIAFYDAHGWNWECALSFVLCKDLFGPGCCVFNPATHFAMPKRTQRANSKAPN